ncbi:MAG: phosphotransferase [Chitinophagaceae bacterium]|nr:phosphotransferase [Chitinophagaceae bacterium]
MQEHISILNDLYFKYKGKYPDSITKIPQSGSDRNYYIISSEDEKVIGTFSLNIKENKAFIYCSHHFAKQQLNTPKILEINEDHTAYLQEYVGAESLLSYIENQGHADSVFDLYKKSLKHLVALQIKGDKNFDYNQCITAKEFGKEAILADLLYFKYYFLDTLQFPYDKQLLLKEFEILADYLDHAEYKNFMFRDFQSRNILVNNNEVYFIDYQGGMKGALQYDVASLLWQAKAELSNEWKEKLLDYYIQELEQLLQSSVNKSTFINRYYGYVLIRLLQVLGAYGFRGLFERKAHFLASIPLALQNLKYFIENKNLGLNTPEFDKILQFVTSNLTIKKFTPTKANESTKLKIEINSFSYKKGLPKDDSGNGGGFMFDMRGILNPGRKDEYKKLTGKDKPVMDYLEQETLMNRYLNSVWDLIDINVEDYLNRGFEHLQINFGCTGGQHRSVYAAEQTARHLKNKYKLKVELKHLNQENWVK